MSSRDLTDLSNALAAKEAYICDKVKTIAQLRAERKAQMDAYKDSINQAVEELEEAVVERDNLKQEILASQEVG